MPSLLSAHHLRSAVLAALAALLTLPASAQTPGTPVATAPTTPTTAPDALPATPVTDAERTSILITSLSLDLHIIPADSREDARATLTLRNQTTAPVPRIPLQISGSLRWQSISAATPAGLRPIAFTQSPIGTDADHTGYAQEAILTPAQPLAPGATLSLSAFYSGTINQSAARLETLGPAAIDHSRAILLDWDAIFPTTDLAATALRGLGNVLWYPVAAPAAILGDTNKLSALVAQQRILDLAATMRLRLTIEYVGDPPDSAIVNGALYPLTPTPDTDTEAIGETHGLATAETPAAPIGYRIPSLFLTAQRPTTTPDQLLTVITPHPEEIDPYARAAALIQPLLAAWLAPHPIAPLLLLDHPGERFEDSAFIAAELEPTLAPQTLAPELVRGLTHAFISAPPTSPDPASLWLDQGIPEFMSLLWTERTQGREAAIAELQHASTLIAFAEPPPGSPAAQPLTQATSDVFLRFKSASVLWQLRELLGDDLFRQSLFAWRRSVTLNPALDRDPSAFERSIEKSSSQDLAWFFHDWVLNDPGLPDLTIVQANPRPLPARPGKSSGYLVAVDVRNDGEAAADVPVIVRAVATSATQRLRIPPHATASVRILFEDTPESVQVNDGSVPELRTTTHIEPIRIATP